MTEKIANLNQGLDFINKYLNDLGINKKVTSSELASIFKNLEKNEDGTIDTSEFALAIANNYSDEEITSIEDEYLEAWEAISGIDGMDDSISFEDIAGLDTFFSNSNDETENSTISRTSGGGGVQGSASGGGSSSGGSVASGSSPIAQIGNQNIQDGLTSEITPASITGKESVSTLEKAKGDAQAQLEEMQSKKENNPEVIAAQEAVADAKTTYDEAMESFEENSAELYEQVEEAKQTKEACDNTVNEKKSAVDVANNEVAKSQGALDGLVEPPQTITEEDPETGEKIEKENPAYAQYLEKKAELEAALEEAEANLATAEDELATAEEAAVAANEALTNIMQSEEMQESQYAKLAADALNSYIEAQSNFTMVETEQNAQINADIALLNKNIGAYDSAIEQAKIRETQEGEKSDNKQSDMTLEEFLDSIEDPQTRDFYERLYELYDFDSFNSRSDIPQYFQTVYTDAFATGTIRSAGCGITSLAMVASYLTGETITPDMLTNGYRGDNPASAMHAGIRNLGLNVTTYEGWGNACADMNGDGTNNLDAALDAGKPVIARVLQSSIFTDAGHFIVIAGKTDDGKYIVNDPNLENYYNQSMVDGFTNGFTRDQITNGLAGIYIVETK